MSKAHKGKAQRSRTPSSDRAPRSRSKRRASPAEPAPTLEACVPSATDRYVLIGLLVAAAAVCVWAYWGTAAFVVGQWLDNPDYSHGVLMLPAAGYLLWLWRDRIDVQQWTPSRWGFAFVAAAALMIVASGRLFFEPLAIWSIPVVIAGFCMLIGGWPLLRVVGPLILFLYLAAPLPSALEKGLRMPLQLIAAQTSSWALNALGQPALAEKNVILLGEHVLEVQQACSGLRMFIGIAAVAAFYVLWISKPWWQKLILMASTAPIAILANTLRITVTGLLYELVSGEAARKFSHDLAGYVMIPVAAAMLAGVVWYLGNAFVEVRSRRAAVA